MSWEYILKSKNWDKLTNDIKNDILPSNRNKYVRYSNLDDINKKMVDYYLDVGKNSTRSTQQKCIKGILEEMLRSSNARYDIEDKERLE